MNLKKLIEEKDLSLIFNTQELIKKALKYSKNNPHLCEIDNFFYILNLVMMYAVRNVHFK